MARNSGGGFGTWFYGFLVGGVIGVGCCAAAALYITKAPIPFVNKVNQASEKINPIAGGTIPDPNKPLSASGGAPENAEEPSRNGRTADKRAGRRRNQTSD